MTVAEMREAAKILRAESRRVSEKAEVEGNTDRIVACSEAKPRGLMLASQIHQTADICERLDRLIELAEKQAVRP